jgi:hypothetical protein
MLNQADSYDILISGSQEDFIAVPLFSGKWKIVATPLRGMTKFKPNSSTFGSSASPQPNTKTPRE